MRALDRRPGPCAKRAPLHSLVATGGPVPQRVRALLAPPTPLRRDLVVAHALLMLICCFSLALSANGMDQLFDTASPGHLHTEAGRAHHHHHEHQ
ncbi:hypothetical protein ACFXOD_36230 [Streptomyces sp. NPDC059161]|uniref:hypothetical protein n=1 Tax=Streptomyces sp. NPDC059161 TaxID=3346749 RepID=UPI0036861712